MKRFAKVMAMLLSALLALTLAQGATTAKAAGGDQIDITDSNVSRVLNSSSEKPLIVMVGATWCSYCKKLYPILERLNERDGGKWRLGHLEADIYEGAAGRFRDVDGYPNSFGFSDGRQMGNKLSGYYPENEVRDWVNQIVRAWENDHPGGQPTPTVVPTTAKPTPTPTSNPVAGEVAVTNGNYRDVISGSSRLPVAFIVGATWSNNTNALLPKLRNALERNRGKFTLGVVMADQDADQAAGYFNPRGYPITIGYTGGKETSDPGRLIGNVDQNAVDAFVAKLIAGGPSTTPTVVPTTAKPTPTGNPGNGGIVDVTDDNFDSVKARSNNLPVVFVVGATWSTYTGKLMPKFEERANRDKGFVLARVYSDKAPSAAGSFNVAGYPTVVGWIKGSEAKDPARWADGNAHQAKVDKYVDDLKAAFGPIVQPTSVKPTPGDGQLPELPEGAVQIESVDQYERDVIEESYKRTVIVDFSKEMCEPCLLLAPILDEKYVADNGKWQYARIDGTEVKEVWDRYDNPWFPTLLAIRDGQELGRYSGFDPDRKQEVIDFINAAANGEKPVTDPKVMSVDDDAAWERAKEISFRHPVVVRLHLDTYVADNADQGKMAAEMANGDGGKWTLANVEVMGPMHLKVAQAMGGGDNVVGPPAVHIIMYQGVARTEDELTVLRQAKADSDGMRSWVNAMLSHHYKPVS